MAKMMKKAEYGTAMGPKTMMKKKSMTPAPKKKKSYPILSDDGENYNGPKVGPREMNPKGMSKNGSKIKKAKDGGAFGMLSVKAGIDKNPNPTAADRIAGAKKMAKKGASVKKCKYGCK
jgi:hypothetical protein